MSLLPAKEEPPSQCVTSIPSLSSGFESGGSGPVLMPISVRTHPVTKQKILSIHQAHARRIFGYKKEESEYLFNFLNDVLVKGGDFQTRAHYEPGTVVVWDK